MDGMEETVEALSQFSYDDEQSELMNALKEASESMDVDECDSIIEKWRNILG